LLLKGFIQPGEAKTAVGNESDLGAKYNELKSSGKPAMIVFTYDADCCRSKRIFFQEYNSKVKLVTDEYKDKLGTLIIDSGTLDEEEMKVMMNIAKENRVAEFPSILLLSENGKPFNVISCNFDENELKKLINGMVNN
jgi:hypothetical protein